MSRLERLGAQRKRRSRVKELGSLTQLGGFAQDEGVGPELGDGGAVEADVTHGLSEAAGREDVRHVESGPEGADDAAEQTHNEDTH